MSEPEAPAPIDDRNPYAAPATVRVSRRRERATQAQLAERSTRLGAFLINGVLTALATIPGIVLGSLLFPDVLSQALDESDPASVLTWMLLVYSGVILLCLFQAYLLTRDGQSIGKKLLRIRIVRRDGQPAGFGRVVLAREVVNFLISFMFGCVPLVGLAYVLIDALFIFGRERRCLHDLIAGTKVVTVAPPRRRYRRPPAPPAAASDSAPGAASTG